MDLTGLKDKLTDDGSHNEINNRRRRSRRRRKSNEEDLSDGEAGAIEVNEDADIDLEKGYNRRRSRRRRSQEVNSDDDEKDEEAVVVLDEEYTTSETISRQSKRRARRTRSSRDDEDDKDELAKDGDTIPDEIKEEESLRKKKINEARRMRRTRKIADKQPEVYILGEILGGSGFGKGVSCVWQVQPGSNWNYYDGLEQGQTHYDYPDDGNSAVWGHPIQIHYGTNSVQGWPKIIMQVWKLDFFGRSELVAYGFCHIPSSGGVSDVECRMWRPVGTMKDDIASKILGGGPRLKHWDTLYSKAWEQRPKLITTGSGVVNLRLNVVLRHFEEQLVEFSVGNSTRTKI